MLSRSFSDNIRALIRSLGYLILLSLTSPPAWSGSPDWTALLDNQQPYANLVSLKAAGNEFYGAFTPSSAAKTHGYVLLLHGASQHPAWPAVINPLRLALPGYGWNALAIELPEVSGEANDEKFSSLLDQAADHLTAGQAFLENKGAKKIVIVAYGLGARMAVDWISKTSPPDIQALALISMADGSKDSGIDSNTELFKISIPVLDIFAEHDSPAVKTAAAERYQHRERMTAYRQLEIDAADPYYSQLDSELVKRLRGWLQLTLKKQ